MEAFNNYYKNTKSKASALGFIMGNKSPDLFILRKNIFCIIKGGL